MKEKKLRNEKKNGPPWTLLTSYLFPYICASLERPEDSHHKYHAAAAPAPRWSASRRARPPRVPKQKKEIPKLDDASPASRDRVCDILWANQDPLSQTVKETHLSFDTLLDVEEARALQEARRGLGSGSARTEKNGVSRGRPEPLKKDVSVKGRYAPRHGGPAAGRAAAGARARPAHGHAARDADDSVCTAAGALVAAVAQSPWRRRWTGTRRPVNVENASPTTKVAIREDASRG